ncbi:MAG TPA: hypothetical protein VKA27_10985 [Sunxiuqinia sp.]|nr:hypothetical protein [Sunxiuqinia sp.]
MRNNKWGDLQRNEVVRKWEAFYNEVEDHKWFHIMTNLKAAFDHWDCWITQNKTDTTQA